MKKKVVKKIKSKIAEGNQTCPTCRRKHGETRFGGFCSGYCFAVEIGPN